MTKSTLKTTAYNLPPFFPQNNFSIPSENERGILGLILRDPGITQSAIAHRSGLAQQSVSRLVKNYVDQGTLKITTRVSDGKRGQPSIPVELASGFAYTFGVAMMTDALSVALMDFSGEILEQTTIGLPAMTRPAVIAELQSIFNDFTARQKLDTDRILGVGVGISGYNLGGRAQYNTPRPLDDWAIVDIDEILSDALGLPVWVENDGNASAIGESLVGVGRRYSSFAYMYIAAGIGGGIIINHKLMRGYNGNGGEIGLILPKKIYAHPNLELLRQIVCQKGIQITGLTDMIADFDPNWPGVDEWVARTSDAFSLIASALAAILDTQAIVFGGRIPKALAEKVISHIEIFDDTRRVKPRRIPRLITSEAPGDACAIGAAAIPFKQFFFAGQG